MLPFSSEGRSTCFQTIIIKIIQPLSSTHCSVLELTVKQLFYFGWEFWKLKSEFLGGGGFDPAITPALIIFTATFAYFRIINRLLKLGMNQH